MNIYRPLAIKLYSFSLHKLNDYNWTGCDLFYHIRDSIKAYSNEPEGLLSRCLRKGLLFKMGCWLYEEYLNITEYYGHIDTLRDDYLLWYLEDIIEFLKYHGASENSKNLYQLIKITEDANELYEADENKYYSLLSKGRKKYTNAYKAVFKIYRRKYFEKLKVEYAAVIANRLFHDRAMCEYISQLLLVIGFDGSTGFGMSPQKWILRTNRISRPWVKDLLREREGGKCASCKRGTKNLAVDHIVPLSKGGCNDLVNLQLLCYDCNEKKANCGVSVNDSIPSYFEKYWSYYVK